ncbi:FMN-binding protein [Arthrobacter sp. U41]|uniref:FMN-binding protein n=1 Tax=Arthrobacter sp. U41 TaxID=1849032 RepID=UPI0008596C37|nr:FMN-binding protein [Arthrobacter sp. U41]AOT02741.1 FMN-binding protein [Arthrobacter sp. U41]
MRIRAAVSAALASAGILLAGWQSGAHVADTGKAAATTSAATSSGALSGSGTGGGAGGTFAGSVVQTRFGAVQVQITVKAGAITDVTALRLTDDDRKSAQISKRAAPVLRAAVIKAQSAQVQTVSGATVTSDAYLSSLQAALDAANL